jgi:hypothetical protein
MLLQIPRSKSKASFFNNVYRTRWVERVVNASVASIHDADDEHEQEGEQVTESHAAAFLAVAIFRTFPDAKEVAFRILRWNLNLASKMVAVSAASMWEDANVGPSQQRKIFKHLSAYFQF